jgi:hypothetical protein
MSGRSIIEEARRTSRTLLTEIEFKALLKEAGIPTVEILLAGQIEGRVSSPQQEDWVSRSIKDRLTRDYS